MLHILFITTQKMIGVLAVIEIDGQEKPVQPRSRKQRFLVKVDDREVWLTGVSFRIFVTLAHFRRFQLGGWIHQTDLSTSEARYIHRLRGELDSDDLIENSGKRDGYYRLGRSDVKFNTERLGKHYDSDVSKLFAEVA